MLQNRRVYLVIYKTVSKQLKEEDHRYNTIQQRGKLITNL